MIAYGTGHASGTVGRDLQKLTLQDRVPEKIPVVDEASMPAPIYGCEVPEHLVTARVAQLASWSTSTGKVGGRK